MTVLVDNVHHQPGSLIEFSLYIISFYIPALQTGAERGGGRAWQALLAPAGGTGGGPGL